MSSGKDMNEAPSAAYYVLSVWNTGWPTSREA